MKTITIIIQNAPYKVDNKAWHALRFAGAALVEDMQVRIHLLDEGIEVGFKGHKVPESTPDLESLMKELMECGLEVMACGMSLRDCQIDEEALIEGIKKGSMKTLASWVKNSDQVLTF